MIVVDVEQGSQEWRDARAGKVTASRVSEILAKGRGGAEATGRRNYRAQIVCEIMTGMPQEDDYMSYDMKRGIELEPFAKDLYEIQFNVDIKKVGLVLHPRNEKRWAASPDGILGESSIIQFKCPKAAIHFEYIIAQRVPPEYEDQMMWEMACTDRVHCMFASYNEQVPKDMRIFTCNLQRNDARIREIEAEVRIFDAEVDMMIEKLDKLRRKNGIA